VIWWIFLKMLLWKDDLHGIILLDQKEEHRFASCLGVHAGNKGFRIPWLLWSLQMNQRIVFSYFNFSMFQTLVSKHSHYLIQLKYSFERMLCSPRFVFSSLLQTCVTFLNPSKLYKLCRTIVCKFRLHLKQVFYHIVIWYMNKL
jgi:hypothetical protein